jgi:glycosyltransferase involved in cell wall biosynthesis
MLVSLVTVGDPDTMTGGYLYHRRLAEMAPEHAAELRFVSFPERLFPLPALARRAVARAASEADVVVVDSIAAAFWGRPRLRIPVVGMAHQAPGGIDHGVVRTYLQVLMDRRAYGRIEPVMVASEDLVRKMVGHGVPAHKIVVVPPGRDVARPDEGSHDLRAGRAAAILCVGNWVERKGIVDLIDAFATLPEDAATLHLVGDDGVDRMYSAAVRARLRDPSFRERVKIHGVLPKETVAALYRDADIFALPSVREPYGTVYGEAMAFGLPVVGWDAGNLPHLAQDGIEGMIVPQGDVLALGRGLAALALDEELRGRLGANARRRAKTFATWSDTARLFFATLRAAVARSNSP